MKYVFIQQTKFIRVQRLTNISMAKAFRTISREALYIVTGMTPIIVKTEEAVKQYNIRKRKGSKTQLIDREVKLKNWPHPAYVVKIIEDTDTRNKQSRYTQTGVRTSTESVWSNSILWKGTSSTTQIQAGQQIFKQPKGTPSYR